MKRFICILFASLLLISSVAIAEVDISSMSLDELIALRQQIDEKIGYPIQGDLICGIDIKEGYYSITYIAPEDTPYEKTAFIALWEDETLEEDKTPSRRLKPGDSFVIHLLEHNVLRVNFDTILLSPVEAPSWQP